MTIQNTLGKEKITDVAKSVKRRYAITLTGRPLMAVSKTLELIIPSVVKQGLQEAEYITCTIIGSADTGKALRALVENPLLCKALTMTAVEIPPLFETPLSLSVTPVITQEDKKEVAR